MRMQPTGRQQKTAISTSDRRQDNKAIGLVSGSDAIYSEVDNSGC